MGIRFLAPLMNDRFNIKILKKLNWQQNRIKLTCILPVVKFEHLNILLEIVTYIHYIV